MVVVKVTSGMYANINHRAGYGCRNVVIERGLKVADGLEGFNMALKGRHYPIGIGDLIWVHVPAYACIRVSDFHHLEAGNGIQWYSIEGDTIGHRVLSCLYCVVPSVSSGAIDAYSVFLARDEAFKPKL